MSLIIPSAPAMPDNAPVNYELYDWSNPAAPVLVSSITLNIQDKSFVPQDEDFAKERGEAAWHRSDKPLVFNDFNFGVHLFVSHAGNTTSGTQPLVEGAIVIHRGGDWKNFPFASGYNKKQMSVFPKPFKIVSKDKFGNVVHTYEMHDGLPMNDPSLWQKYPTETQPLRPKVCAGMFLPYWNERPRRSALLEKMFPGIIDEALRPSAAKSHFTFNGCEPMITGGYSGNSLNSLGNIYVHKQWPMPKAAYWPEDWAKADPYFPYSDACYDGHSAFMGPWVEGWDYEPGSFTTHNGYTAPGGPRPDRAAFASQLVLWAANPNGKRPDGVTYADIAYGYTLAYGNTPNKFVSDPTTMYLRPDADLMHSLYFTGNYYGDGPGDSDNAIRLNGDQRDGTTDWAYDLNGDMVYNGRARDSLHDYENTGEAAILMQSPMLAAMSKFDTTTSMMLHGQWSGRGSDWDGGSYMVRDMSWKWKHIVIAWKLAADHPLFFNRASLEAYFTEYLELIHRDILMPLQTGLVPDNAKHYFAGISRFGHPMVNQNGKWGSPAGGLGLYLGGVLAYMKQSGMWATMQAKGGKAWEALMFTLRNACQYAFGIFSQTRGDLFPYAQYPEHQVFSDGTDMPVDWKEFGERTGDGTYFNGPNPDSCWGGDRDVSVHPTIQFCYVMRDFFPEIDHPWKADALAKIDKYLANQTALVNSKTDATQKRDADHTWRYPGIAPLKAPAIVGPGNPETLPELKEIKLDQAYVAPAPVVGTPTTAPTVDGTWELIGKEYDDITVDANTTLRYGLNGNYVYAIASGAIKVGNDFFGSDPAYGSQKTVEKFVPAPAQEAPQAPQTVPPTSDTTSVVETPIEAPAPVVVPPVVIPPITDTVASPDYGKAFEAACVAFLQSLGRTVV